MSVDNLFWRDTEDSEPRFKAPDDVFDLVFRLQGSRLEIDHAYALAEALRNWLDPKTCTRIGVLGVHMAESGNGWSRPEQSDAEMPLSRRARLSIRLHRDDQAEVAGITGKRLRVGQQELQIGESSVRGLSSNGNLYARAISCDPEQTEPEFLAQVAGALQSLDINVARMICGRCGKVRSGEVSLFTRALLVVDLKPEESVTLQRRGLGKDRLLGCGLFVPHKGIDAVYTAQE